MAEDQIVLYAFMISMLLLGSANTLIGKLMDLSKGNGHTFNHPFFQAALMFLGEFLCLILYHIYTKFSKVPNSDFHSPLHTQNAPKSLFPKLGKFIFMIPSFFDFCASTLMFIGLTLSAPSVYQMMRGFIMVIVSVYSVVLLKTKLFKHQILGVILAFTGVVIVGLASITNSASSAPNPVLGVFIIIIAQFFAGGVFVTEQLFLEDINVHPLQAVGIEGLTGLCYYIVVLPVLNLIPCDNADLCNGGFVENSVEALRQIGDSWVIFLCFIGFMISIALFNFTGVTVTQKAGALARSTIDTSRTVVIWVFSILVGWEDFIPLQLAGFFLMVVGTLVYNEVLKTDWMGLRQSMEDKQRYMALVKHKKRMEESEYVGYSPGATYDSQHYRKAEGNDIEIF